MLNRSSLIAAGALLLFATGPTLAGGNSDAPAPFNISIAQDFAQQAATVHSGMQQGGTYASLNARDRYLVTRDIDMMTDLMQRRGGITAMTDSERVHLFNAQTEANRLLSGDVSESVMCAYAPQTGSHVPRTLCWADGDI